MSFKKSVVLIFALLAAHCANAQTVAQVFDFAEATYPTLFSGTPVSGTYLQYTYRFYPTSKNYLAVDNTNVISVLGPATGNVIRAIGPVSTYTPDINTWLAKQSTSGSVAAAAAIVCPSQAGTAYSKCQGTGSNTMVSILDPVYINSFKGLTGKITDSTQPGIGVGSACSFAIETWFGIFVAKFGTITNTQLSFQGRATDTITLNSAGAVVKIVVIDPSKGQTIEVRTVNGGAEYVSWINSTQYAVCTIK